MRRLATLGTLGSNATRALATLVIVHCRLHVLTPGRLDEARRDAQQLRRHDDERRCPPCRVVAWELT